MPEVNVLSWLHELDLGSFGGEVTAAMQDSNTNNGGFLIHFYRQPPGFTVPELQTLRFCNIDLLRRFTGLSWDAQDRYASALMKYGHKWKGHKNPELEVLWTAEGKRRRISLELTHGPRVGGGKDYVTWTLTLRLV